MSTALVFTDFCGDKEKHVCPSIALYLLYVTERTHKHDQSALHPT